MYYVSKHVQMAGQLNVTSPQVHVVVPGVVHV